MEFFGDNTFNGKTAIGEADNKTNPSMKHYF